MSHRQFAYTQHSHKGNVRQHNEDACAFFQLPDEGLLAVVCDGMGGYLGGGRASKIAVERIGNYFSTQKLTSAAEIIEAFAQAFSQAHIAITYHAEKNPLLRGMGTTCVALLLHPQGVFCAHVGDSRLYFYHNERLIQLTKDHSYVQTLIDEGIITPAEAIFHPKRHFIERALGSEDAQPDIQNLTKKLAHMQAGDMFLLCSDGLINEVSDVEINIFLSDHTRSLEEKADNLLEKALSKLGSDNITLQLIEKIG